MREISTEKIKIGEHVLIDGVEYVTEKADFRIPCEGCAFDDESKPCSNFIECDGVIYVKVKKEPKLMTNRQMAELISKGYGQYGVRYSEYIDVYSNYNYLGSDDDTPVATGAMVRPWGSSEWLRPTVDIYNDFCHPRCKEDE